MIIGIGHKKRMGKTTIAKILVKEYGFKMYAFADIVKLISHNIFEFTEDEIEKKEEIVPFWGLSPRQAYQRVGETMRKEFGNMIWCKALKKKLNGENIVIHDVRHIEEANFVKDMGGLLWKVNKGAELTIIKRAMNWLKGEHISERALNTFKGWDIIIENQKTEAELNNLVGRALFISKNLKVLKQIDTKDPLIIS